MNNQLYKDLIKLVNTNDSFYSKTVTVEERIYQIFNYRLAIPSDYDNYAAWEARGIVFDVTCVESPVLVCRAPQKFFNYKENYHTDLDLNTLEIEEVSEKLDGTMINAFWGLDNKLHLKTKVVIDEGQFVNLVNIILNTEEYKQLRKLLEFRTEQLDVTVNMELTTCNPDMMVVVKHKVDSLRIFSVRHNKTGNYFSREALVKFFGRKYLVPELTRIDPNNLVNAVLNSTDENFEGIVVRYEDQKFFKLKSKLYQERHSLKGGITEGETKLFEMIINESIDDHKSYFNQVGGTYVVGKIEFYENLIIPKYNHLIHDIDNYYSNNKHLDRKEYAIGAKASLGQQMGLAMELYLGKQLDMKAWALKNKEYFIPKGTMYQYKPKVNNDE